MISRKVERVIFFTACSECEYLGNAECPHPYFAGYFANRKIKDVGCELGKVKKHIENESKKEAVGI